MWAKSQVTRMPGGVTVGDSGLCCYVPCLLSAVVDFTSGRKVNENEKDRNRHRGPNQTNMVATPTSARDILHNLNQNINQCITKNDARHCRNEKSCSIVDYMKCHFMKRRLFVLLIGPLVWLNMLSLIHIWRCRRDVLCRSRWSPYH